jgi:hypothetical protein
MEITLAGSGGGAATERLLAWMKPSEILKLSAVSGAPVR